VLALALGAFAASVAFAQTTNRSGIEGKVTDQSGAMLPGVTVTISSPALQAKQLTSVTDGEGRYRFTTLPNGAYRVTFELAGFQTVKHEDVRLEVGFVAAIDVKMAVGGVQETVTVTGQSPVVDVRTTAVSTSFSKDALETVPNSRSMWQILQMSPGLRITSSTPDVGGSSVGSQQGYANYGGRGTSGNKPTLDGVDTRELEDSAGFYYDYGAFEEVQIKAMGNDAEVAVSGTNFVGILKSGGNTFHGKGFFSWESPDLQSSNITDELRAQGISEGNPLKQYYDVNGDLGGRIIRDRLWFYGGVRKQRIRSGVIGYDGDYLVTVTNATGKLTTQINPKHKFNGFLQVQSKDQPERDGSAYRPKLSSRHQVFKPKAGKIEWTWVASDRSLVNAFLGRWYYDTTIDVYTHDPATYDLTTLMYSGAYKSTTRSEPSFNHRGRWQYNVSVSHYKPDFLGGTHDLKAGTEITQEDRKQGMEPLGGGADYMLRFRSGVPYEIMTYNVPFSSNNVMDMQSAYMKDSWRIGEGLTMNLGARVERYHLFLPEQTKPAGAFSDAATFPKTEIRTWTGVAPRVGFSYALTNDARTVVKATYGRFNWVLDAATGENYNRNAVIVTDYRWNDLNKNKAYDPGELGAFVSATGGSNRVINPDVKQPKVDEVTLSLERELVKNFSARASYIYKNEHGLIQDVNTARPYGVYNIAINTVDPGPDGVVGTADDGKPITIFDYDPAYAGSQFEKIVELNLAGNRNVFHNIELVANKRLSKGWQMVASSLATHRDIWRNGIPTDPNAANFYPKSVYWEWVFKLSGSYMLRYEVQVAAMFTHQSGDPLARDARFTGLKQLSSVTLLMEPMGSERMPNQNLLNFRVEKRQRLGSYGQVSFQFDLFNAANTNTATTTSTRSGPTYGRITAIIPPRIARLGVTYTF
jgi:hypothetical protein